MYVLGLSCYGHDPAAALLRDGELIAAAEEERFTRYKHSRGFFPTKAIQFVLKYAGIKLSDIDAVGSYFDHSIGYKQFYHQPAFLTRDFKKWGLWTASAYYAHKRTLDKLKSLGINKVFCVKHHDAHVYSAYYASKFQKANGLVIDASGEVNATSLYSCRGNDIELVKEIFMPKSLGRLYSGVTNYLGFFPNGDEWKVMGLSSFGKPKFRQRINKLLWATKTGYDVDKAFFNKMIQKDLNASLFRHPLGQKERTTEYPINNFYEHIAASVQEHFTDMAFNLNNILIEKTGYKNLAYSGGCAMNSKTNGELNSKSRLSELYIPPQAADAGAALGAAFYVYYKLTGKRARPINSAFYGTEYSNEDILATIKKNKLPYAYHKDIAGATAELIAKGKIVGWFNGRMEIGARALGARSILANPATPDMKDKINYYVKGREEWRPFAVSVTDNKYFENEITSPFMTLTDGVKEQYRESLAAGIHVDGSSRPQTVEKEVAPLYYDLINKVGKVTGVNAVLNTSFNVAGEPIVENPSQAIADLYSTGMDALAIGNFLITKERT